MPGLAGAHLFVNRRQIFAQGSRLNADLQIRRGVSVNRVILRGFEPLMKQRYCALGFERRLLRLDESRPHIPKNSNGDRTNNQKRR